MLTTSEIAIITGGVLTGPGDIMVNDLLPDSRKASSISSNALFVAISGERNDGHSFIGSLYRSGVRAFLAEKDPEVALPHDAAIIVTPDSVRALQEIALNIRNRFGGTLISLTGSTGKTIVKEWLSDILGNWGRTVRSPRSYNSQTGVPLSLWRLNNNYRYAVIEAGMSRPGEIERLEHIIRPDVGVITNIGEAHQENFSSFEEKVSEKIKLFTRCNTIVYCADHGLIRSGIEGAYKSSGKKIFCWSSSPTEAADIYFVIKQSGPDGTGMEIIFGSSRFEFKIPFADKASIENTSTVLAVVAAMGLPLEKAIESVSVLEPVAMRMEKKEGINSCTLVEDFYNSDPGSLGMALDHLRDLPGRNKTLIVSDFMQSGRDIVELGEEIVVLSSRAGVNRFICIGEGLSGIREMFPEGTLFFLKTADFTEWFAPDKFNDEAILLKGARTFGFEEIGYLLEYQVHTTRLEINLNRVLENLNFYRSKLRKGTRIMAMIKAFAYGAGPRDIAGWLNYNGIDFLTVAYTDEGIALRKAGVSNRIVVMSPEPASFRSMIEYDLEPELFSIDIARSFISEAEKNGLVDYPVHIKLDTGMHRLGIEEKDIEEAATILKGTASVIIASVFSHLGSSEKGEHDNLTVKQAELYEKMSGYLREIMGVPFLRHLLNTSGIERFPEYQYDMVRIGIGLYYRGGTRRGEAVTATSFKSTISQVKRVAAGEGIGYGFTDISDRDRVIAVVPVGYADGLPRMLGEGRISMFVKGSRVPTAGRVCMDMCMVDITGLEVSPGDDVEIFGPNISILEIAEACGTIPHEILTGIPPRVRRVFLYD